MAAQTTPLAPVQTRFLVERQKNAVSRVCSGIPIPRNLWLCIPETGALIIGQPTTGTLLSVSRTTLRVCRRRRLSLIILQAIHQHIIRQVIQRYHIGLESFGQKVISLSSIFIRQGKSNQMTGFKFNICIRNRISTIALLGLCIHCDSSPLGPQMSDRDPSLNPDGVGENTTGDDGGTTAPTTPGGGNSNLTATCNRDVGHDVWYIGASVSLSFTCDQSIDTVTTTDMPSYLTATVSDTVVSFAGAAPDASESIEWSFLADGFGATAGDASAITTTVIDTTHTTSVFADPDVANNNNTAITLSLDTLTLDSSWDGNIADVNLDLLPATIVGDDATSDYHDSSIAIADTDIHGLQWFDSCSSADLSTPYLCMGDLTRGTGTLDLDFKLKWPYSAFDQGTYFFSGRPALAVEGAEFRLSDVNFSYTIPIQSTGKITITHGVESATEFQFIEQHRRYAITVNDYASTATTPVLGLIYYTQDTNFSAQFKRVIVDRTDDPTDGTSDGLTQSSQIQLNNSADSQDFDIVALGDGRWLTVGARGNGGIDNLWLNFLDDGTTPAINSLPTLDADRELTEYGANINARWVDLSQPFTDDDGETRVGLAFVRDDDNGSATNYLVVAKLNVSGTTEATILDDADYMDSGGFELSNDDKIDRANIEYNAESGTGYFYLAYRNNTDVYVHKILANKSGGSYSPFTPVSISSLFANAAESNNQAIHMAIGNTPSATHVGVAYVESQTNNSNTPYCYFRKVSSDLATLGNVIQLSSEKCYYPSVHYNPNSGRFVVVYAENDTGAGYNIIVKEITLGTTDSADDGVIVATVSDYTNKLKTDFYPAGNFMGIIYWVNGESDPKFHGFHVKGQ